MNIGLTYDLRDDYLAAGFSPEETAEFDRPDTIDALEEALRALGHETDRIGNIQSLVSRLARGERWDMVFNIAEGLYGFGREAQIPALLEAYQIPVTFSDSLVLALALHKGFTKRIVGNLGIPTPPFVIVEDMTDLGDLSLNYPLLAKPIAEGTGKGINASSKIDNPEALRSVCIRLLAGYKQPVLIETFLPGREFTVGMIGTGQEAEAVGTVEVVLNEQAEKDVYSYENKERCEELVEYRPVDKTVAAPAEEMALAIWRAFGCRDAGRIDFRMDDRGRLNFLEINPLAGLHPSHSDLPIICSLQGITYRELIGRIVSSACKRITIGSD